MKTSGIFRWIGIDSCLAYFYGILFGNTLALKEVITNQ